MKNNHKVSLIFHINSYLPMGSVVLLHNGTKKIMIYGRRQLAADSGKLYDYVACLYPEGNISPEYTFLFNHDEVSEVVFEGYTDDEEKQFTTMLTEMKE